MEKINVIIDSDVTSNIDDRFAICYAFANQNILDIKAITIAPYKPKISGESVEEFQLDSKFETNRLLALMGVISTDYVYQGSEGFVSFGYDERTLAVEKIISEAKKVDKLIVISIGPLTNLAIALNHYKKLKDKIHIVWLGTGNLLLDTFEDHNYQSDKKAFEIVVKSGVELTVIPNYLARQIVSSKFEMEHNISNTVIGRYLVDCVKSFDEITDMGIKTIFDIVPVAYVLHQEYFKTKDIDANELLKEQKLLKNSHKIHYVYDMMPNSAIWKDFVISLNKIDENPFAPKIFFISDTHFSQERKVKIKQVPFKTVEESDREIVRRWNSVVSKNDIVYHLGDFGTYEKIKELNGKVVLICGNYEEEDYGENFEPFKEKLLSLGFYEVHQNGIYLDEKIVGEKLFLTHRPLEKVSDCFTLFGHVHTLKPICENGFNVCLAYHNFTPISTSKIKRYINFVKNHADDDVFA